MKVRLELKLNRSIIKYKMIKRFIKPKNKKAIFICQFTENFLKVIKCQLSHGSKREFADLGLEEIPPDLDSKKLSERLSRIFKKLEYNNNPVIVSLPRYQVTCRYLNVPAQIPAEIEKIVNFQASKYLPYPANELITGYQIVSTDRGGYSNINLVIAHKDIIERYIKAFGELNIKNIAIVLSSYGLCNLYHYIEPQEIQPTIIIDIDLLQVEIAIVSGKKLLFSRSFKINRQQQNWQDILVEEINKTKDAYLKEIQDKEPSRIIVVGSVKDSQELGEILKRDIILPIIPLSYWEKITASENFLNNIVKIDNSLVNLVGLGLKEIPESLNLLPQGIKEQARKIFQVKERLRIILFILGIILIWGLGIAKNLDNKARYLKQLKIELSKIEKEAKPLGELVKRFEFLESQLQKKPSSLDILYELYQIIPSQISLINFTYEEDNQVVLRGNTLELQFVFDFVSQLEKSSVFKHFNVKVRYATKKRIPTGEVVDFEIICAKK